MNLNDDTCYAAVKSRDARFDGRFFTAVRTTGVYCRPVCPARTPQRRNVTFYPCAAAAEAAGYRPCLRCRPESAPGSPAWNGTAATVSRGLRLIDDGIADTEGVEGLATRLGVTSRHLRRLFEEHLGVAPLAIAQSRRVHFGRKLLEETTLPITDIAFTAGFNSVRRFNDAMKQVYGCPPRELRRAAPPTNTTDHGLTVRLNYRKPYDAHALFDFFAKRAIPGVETVEGCSYRRVVQGQDASGIVSLAWDNKTEAFTLTVPLVLARELPRLAAAARRAFDLNADSNAIDSHLATDKTLRPLVKKRPGLRLPGAWDPFETAVRAIVGQQISVAGAVTAMGKLAKRYGQPLEGDDSLTTAFPRPGALAKLNVADAGMPRKRAETLRNLARAVRDGALLLGPGKDLDTLVTELCAMPGIGPWTAQYIAMRALAEPDAFPAGDLGLQKAAGNGDRLSERELLAMAEKWRPWRAYAAVRLWVQG